MARKHRRRTRKRNKKGGFAGILGPKMSAKVDEGVQGWKDIGADVKARAEVGAAGMKQAYSDVERGYKSKTQPGGMLGPVPGPPASPPPLELPMAPTMEPTTEKKGWRSFWIRMVGFRRSSSISFIIY